MMWFEYCGLYNIFEIRVLTTVNHTVKNKYSFPIPPPGYIMNSIGNGVRVNPRSLGPRVTMGKCEELVLVVNHSSW